MLKLTSIEFTNFKVFGSNTYKVSFNDSDLMLLDGPNGYGKTSVFDAIELALSGTIKRFITTDGRQTPEDVVVAWNPLLDVLIDIVLSEESGEEIYIRRKLKSPIPSGAQKISRFAELWDAFTKVDSTWRLAKQSDIEKILQNTNFPRDFHLFHYIPQEEAAFFLKTNSETARASQISQLFGDTEAAETKYSKLKTIEKRLSSQRTLQIEHAELLKRSHNIEQGEHTQSLGLTQHKYLLPWLQEIQKSPEWDQIELPALEPKKLSLFLSELSKLSELVKNRDLYLEALPYSIAARSTGLISDYIYFYNSLEIIPDLERKISIDKALSRCHASLITDEIPSNLADIFELLGRTDFEQFRMEKTIVDDLRRTSSGLKAIYRKVVSHTSELRTSLEILPDESKCLFCGKPHDSHGELELAASARAAELSLLLSTQDISILKLDEQIKTRFIDSAISQIEEYRTKNVVLTDKVMTLLKDAELSKERLNKFDTWLKKCPFDVQDLLIPTLPSDIDSETLSSNHEEMMLRIHRHTPLTPIDYQTSNEDGAFDRIFKDYFNNKNNHLLSIDPDDVEQKKQYLKFCLQSSSQAIIKEIEAYISNAEKLDSIIQALAGVSAKILKKIRRYKKKLIGDIEIPFYIYSGKILQSHQAGIGLGVFLKDPTGGDELKNVRLVSDYQRDHDILNTMSSGQISAVVISLTLALNKIYAKNFSPILIDDPVQTMDDINMSSLVELLRNEFPNRQIVLSTHEENVARYFIYKYLKYGRRVRQLNLMTGEEYDSLDNYTYPSDTKSSSSLDNPTST